jgi:hypothetical protein
MGVDCGDYNNDGLLDFHVTSYQRDWATLYRNLDNGMFEDVTQTTGAGGQTYVHVTWGNGFADFDNDGDLDIFISCGHLQDNVERFDRTTSYHAPNQLMENQGNEKFLNVSQRAGDGMKVTWSSRGAGFDDLDNDGDIDVVISNSRRGPTLLRNDTINKHHWLDLRLRGTKANRDGIGSHVTVIAGDRKRTAEVHSGRGYQSHFGMRLHFGLAAQEKADRIEIQWLGGGSEVIEDVPADQIVTITEGQGQSKP